MLWYLMSSIRSRTRLVDSLSKQATAVLAFAEYPGKGQDLFPGIARFIYRYWTNIATTRGFALNNPRLFRSELARINPGHGSKAIFAILMSASNAIGASFPTKVAEKLRELERR